MIVPTHIMEHGVGAPSYATPGAAGADLSAAVENPVVLRPGECQPIPTGLRMAIPPWVEGQIRARSGLAIKHRVTVMNGVGTVDSDYRGEIKVLLVNHSDTNFVVTRGMRIAQLVLSPVVKGHFFLTDELDKTDRGEGGFGSTG